MKKYSLVFVGCFLFMLGCKAEKVKDATEEKLSTSAIESVSSEVDEVETEVISVEVLELEETKSSEVVVKEEVEPKNNTQAEAAKVKAQVQEKIELTAPTKSEVTVKPIQEEDKKPEEVVTQVSTGSTFAEADVKEKLKDKIEPATEIVPEVKESKKTLEISHEVFNELLKKYVSANGMVDYAGLKSEITVLDGYLAELSSNSPADAWSKSKKLAYWINAYNAFTLKLILDNYPLSSITNLYGGKPWDKKWIEIGGKTYSLNNIENDIIRPTFNEPRIHFAVNCAAVSCPKLGNFAFTENNLEAKLEKNTREFINSSQNSISADQVQVSKIFDWYKEDFGDLVEFLNKYSETKISSGTKVKFGDYDWKLNGK